MYWLHPEASYHPGGYDAPPHSSGYNPHAGPYDARDGVNPYWSGPGGSTGGYQLHPSHMGPAGPPSSSYGMFGDGDDGRMLHHAPTSAPGDASSSMLPPGADVGPGAVPASTPGFASYSGPMTSKPLQATTAPFTPRSSAFVDTADGMNSSLGNTTPHAQPQLQPRWTRPGSSDGVSDPFYPMGGRGGQERGSRPGRFSHPTDAPPRPHGPSSFSSGPRERPPYDRSRGLLAVFVSGVPCSFGSISVLCPSLLLWSR